MSEHRLDRARRRAAAARGARALRSTPAASPLFPADGLYGLACDPLSAEAIERIHEIKGRDDGKPSAVMYFSPAGRCASCSARGRAHREAVGGAAARAGDARDRQPRAPLSARLPRGPRAARRPADRGPARRRAHASLFQTSANRSGEPPPVALRRRRRRRSSTPVDLAIDGGELTGLPSTVVDLTAIEDGGGWRVLREGAVSPPSWNDARGDRSLGRAASILGRAGLRGLPSPLLRSSRCASRSDPTTPATS